MDYTELAKNITTDNANYKIVFNDGSEEVVKMFVLHTNFGSYPCMTDESGKGANIPYPYYKLGKIEKIFIAA